MSQPHLGIFSDKKLATGIVDLLLKHNGTQHEISQVPAGYQVQGIAEPPTHPMQPVTHKFVKAGKLTNTMPIDFVAVDEDKVSVDELYTALIKPAPKPPGHAMAGSGLGLVSQAIANAFGGTPVGASIKYPSHIVVKKGNVEVKKKVTPEFWANYDESLTEASAIGTLTLVHDIYDYVIIQVKCKSNTTTQLQIWHYDGKTPLCFEKKDVAGWKQIGDDLLIKVTVWAAKKKNLLL